jgi:hypothetical protein
MVFHRTKDGEKMRKMAVMFGILLMIGAVSAGVGTAVGATGVFQGKAENIEAKSTDGSLLISARGRLIDNIPVNRSSETHGTLFMRGRGTENTKNAVVGMPPLDLRMRMATKAVPHGVRIDLHYPALEEVNQMREKDVDVVDEAIGIIENQTGISMENVRAHITRNPENMEEINTVELWFTHTENDETIFGHAVVGWEDKEITSFENICEFGHIPVPTENVVSVEELQELESIAMQDDRVREITDGEWYIFLPGTVMENEGELILRVKSSYTILVDLENNQVESVEETEMPQPPFQMPW